MDIEKELKYVRGTEWNYFGYIGMKYSCKDALKKILDDSIKDETEYQAIAYVLDKLYCNGFIKGGNNGHKNTNNRTR